MTPALKDIFATQNPAIKTTCRKLYPNWKIRNLLKLTNRNMPIIWMRGIAFSIDEITIGFQDKPKGKRKLHTKLKKMAFRLMYCV